MLQLLQLLAERLHEVLDDPLRALQPDEVHKLQDGGVEQVVPPPVREEGVEDDLEHLGLLHVPQVELVLQPHARPQEPHRRAGHPLLLPVRQLHHLRHDVLPHDVVLDPVPVAVDAEDQEVDQQDHRPRVRRRVHQRLDQLAEVPLLVEHLEELVLLRRVLHALGVQQQPDHLQHHLLDAPVRPVHDALHDVPEQPFRRLLHEDRAGGGRVVLQDGHEDVHPL